MDRFDLKGFEILNPAEFVTGAMIGLLMGGCGTAITRDYANSIIGADGRAVTLDEIQRIVDDANLDAEQRRQQIRALGIEDQKLVEALLEL